MKISSELRGDSGRIAFLVFLFALYVSLFFLPTLASFL